MLQLCFGRYTAFISENVLTSQRKRRRNIIFVLVITILSLALNNTGLPTELHITIIALIFGSFICFTVLQMCGHTNPLLNYTDAPSFP